MTREYFGVVTKVRQRGAGELRGLARFENGARDTHFNPEQHFEPAGNVFIDKVPAGLMEGVPVWFDAEENPNPKGSDRWWVSHDRERPRLDLQGFAVLDTVGSVVDRAAVRPILRQNIALATGLRVYLRYETECGPCLRGPWTVRDGVLDAAESELHEWPDRSWPEEDHFKAENGSWEILLSALDPGSGRLLDHMSGDQLTLWFLRQAEQIPPLHEIVKGLHREGKRLLKAGSKDLSEESDRRLFLDRFRRMVSILETLELGNSELERIAKAPAFERLWQDALLSRTSELEAQANAEVRGLKAEQEVIKRNIGRLQHQQEELDTKVRKIREKERKSNADLAAIKKKRDELETHIGDNQQRLLNDARALVPLLAGRDSIVVSTTQPPAIVPAVGAAVPTAPATDPLLGVTIRSCRLTLLLDPFSARQFAAEQGWRMFVLQVEPHWLCFDDAWRAGLRWIFETSVHDGSATLLHLQDLDRSPPELWLRPVLDLASGLRDALIEGERGWPEALRVTATLAPGPPRHPLGKWLLSHFAAPEPVSELGERAGGKFAGAAGLELFWNREVKTLVQLLIDRGEADPDDDFSRFENRAREIRLEWPLSFEQRT